MILKGDTGKLEINVLKRGDSETNDYWDGNWLETEIIINVPGYNAFYGTNLRVDELQRFLEGLIALQTINERVAKFTTMEDGLYLHCEVESNGTVNVNGKANNNTGSILDFRLQTDLASLDIFVNELRGVLKLYPLVGSLE